MGVGGGGGLIFLVTYHRLIPAKLPLAPLVGLALVILPVGVLDASYLYPGWATVLPVLGTVILIAFAAPGHSWVAKAPGGAADGLYRADFLWHLPVALAGDRGRSTTA